MSKQLKPVQEIIAHALAIVVGMLIATNTVADFYKMGDLRDAARDKRYNITVNFVRGSVEMWLATTEDSPEIRSASGKCINEFSSEALTWDMLEQKDKYPDDLPVVVVIESILDDCLHEEIAE